MTSPHKIRCLLVANRAEVASRVFDTAARLGIRTVAVYSSIDAGLPFVQQADQAVCIGPAAASQSYLNIPAILEAAARTGADAIHPGYGFLAERADFAEAVQGAGLTWIGPDPHTIRAVGDKAKARDLADLCGIPVLDGFYSECQDSAIYQREAEALGFPVLLKAVSGGGGRGMRRVHRSAELPAAFASAAREAASAFGDPALLLERYLPIARHIEVQVFGDRFGRVVHLFERDCSVQRRHQKVIEEAPAIGLSPALRQRLYAAAVKLVSAADYVGAGTVEFLVAGDSFYFLELNPRLQVEHEVTECITGTDLVAWQLSVAEGEHLPPQSEITQSGHAIEVRVVGETPDWRPSHGKIHTVDLQGARVRRAYCAGDVLTVHYDPLIAKIIEHGHSRADAVRQIARRTEQAWITGVHTNLPLLRAITADPVFAAGAVPTTFLQPRTPPQHRQVATLAAAITLAHQAQLHPSRGIPPGFRVSGPAWLVDRCRVAGEELVLRYRWVGRTLQVGDTSVEIHQLSTDSVELTMHGIRARWRLHHAHPQVFVHTGRVEAVAELLPRFPPPAPPTPEPGTLIAPTPGTVCAVMVGVGDAVDVGATLLVVEAMKMEHRVTSPAAGVVEAVRVQVGDAVDAGQVLVRMAPLDP